MLEGLRSRPALVPLLPFARQWHCNDDGGEHDVVQAEGGEQGDPLLMPALYSLAQHAALSEAAAGLREGEAIFAFLDDTYVVSGPGRRAVAPCAHSLAPRKRPAYGMRQVRSPATLPASSRLAQTWSGNAQSKNSCSAVSMLSVICSPRGSFCCSVPRRAQTICFGCCRPARRKASHTSMTALSVRVLRICFFKAPNIRCPKAPQSATETAAPLAAARHAAACLREQGYNAPP